MIKVAIDKGPLTSGHAVRGVGAYTREIIEALKKITKGKKGIKITPLDFSTQSSRLKAQNFDLIHYPYFHPFFLTLPLSKPAKTVVTIHDLIPLIYPKQYPPGTRGKFKFKLQKYLIKRVDGIITPSETSKKDIVRFLGIPQGKIEVIYEAPRKIFRRITDHRTLNTAKRKYKLPERFVLYVGDVNYNKNILGLAEACKIARIPLVIIGKQAADESVDLTHPENRLFAEFLEKYGDDSRVTRLGFVPDKELVAIYNLASVYCQPSFYEGFGLPVLEAMACGVPVIAAKTQALVEVAEEAALFADPKNPKDISNKITKILRPKDDQPVTEKNSRQKSFGQSGGQARTKEDIIEKGLERARNFSWNKAAKETIEYYSNVISDK